MVEELEERPLPVRSTSRCRPTRLGGLDIRSSIASPTLTREAAAAVLAIFEPGLTIDEQLNRQSCFVANWEIAAARCGPRRHSKRLLRAGGRPRPEVHDGATEVIDLSDMGRDSVPVLAAAVQRMTVADFNYDLNAWRAHDRRLRANLVTPSLRRDAWAKAHEGTGTTGLHIHTLRGGRRLTQGEILMEEHDPADPVLWPEHEPFLADWSCVENAYAWRKRTCAALWRAREKLPKTRTRESFRRAEAWYKRAEREDRRADEKLERLFDKDENLGWMNRIYFYKLVLSECGPRPEDVPPLGVEMCYGCFNRVATQSLVTAYEVAVSVAVDCLPVSWGLDLKTMRKKGHGPVEEELQLVSFRGPDRIRTPPILVRAHLPEGTSLSWKDVGNYLRIIAERIEDGELSEVAMAKLPGILDRLEGSPKLLWQNRRARL